MPTQLTGLTARLRAVFADFTAGQKAVTALAALAVVVAAVGVSMWAAKPSYTPLFTNLAAEDAAAITEELSSAGTSYQLGDGGSTVLVPRQDVYQLRLNMSAAGLPSASKGGYALLDEQGITTSEFKQRVDFQRALEGELSTTITALDDVQEANVHLVIPKETLFSDDARQPSASVMVRTKPGKQMSSAQVRGVVHLVASSVEGLDPAQVTLTDASGKVLSAPGEDGVDAAAGDARAEQTRAFEEKLSRSVENMLIPVVGGGGAVVTVNAELDFDQRRTRTETYQTDEQAPTLSESTTAESYNGTGTVVGGVLGPENVELPDGGTSEYDKETAQRAYGVGKVVEQAKSAPGQVKRLSVAVVLDGGKAGTVPPAQVEALVAAATGLDRERGDVIEVSRLAFDDTAEKLAAEEQAKAEAAERREQMFGTARTIGILLLVGILLLLAVRSLRKTERETIELPVEPYPVLEAEQAGMLDDGEGALALEGAAANAIEAPVSPETNRRLEIQGELSGLVERQPEEVAQLLRGWLADRRS
jgi:flagellar M-ring protein FliF